MWESLFNSEYCEIFKSAYFVEHLQTNASENVFMKLILPQVSSTWMSETSLWIVFHDWFPVKFLFTYNISLNKRRSKFQKKNMSCERALIFDQWKTFSENYKPMRVWLWLVYKICREVLSLATFLRIHSNLKSTCHIKLKIFLWTKLLENLLHAEYLTSVAATLDLNYIIINQRKL